MTEPAGEQPLDELFVVEHKRDGQWRVYQGMCVTGIYGAADWMMRDLLRRHGGEWRVTTFIPKPGPVSPQAAPPPGKPCELSPAEIVIGGLMDDIEAGRPIIKQRGVVAVSDPPLPDAPTLCDAAITPAPRTGEHFLAINFDQDWGTCGGKKQHPSCVVHYWSELGTEGFYPSLGPDEPFAFTHWKALPRINALGEIAEIKPAVPPDPPAESPTEEVEGDDENDVGVVESDPRTGFDIRVNVYTEEGEASLVDPETVRRLIGEKFDHQGIEEEIDYTLEVKRVHY